MECRLQSSSDTWSCQVSIRWEYEHNGNRCAVVREDPFGPLITDKADVELMLRRAQAAVLHPRTPAVQFVSLTAGQLGKDLKLQERSLLFSKNVVCVDLAGPELTDLSFVDLPGACTVKDLIVFMLSLLTGIISNADPEVVKFVEDLVKTHIQGNCLILVTLPMSGEHR